MIVFQHHPALYALPAVLPAVVVVGVIVMIAVRDRRAQRRKPDDGEESE